MANIKIEQLQEYENIITLDDVIEDISENYKITNIADDNNESLYYLSKALYDDYVMRRANYKAYIEKDMDARLLMEIRKSVILPMDKELYDFYEMHSNCNNAEQVKGIRKKFLKFLNNEYEDYNWQYYYLVINFLRSKAKNFIFDYESCFADGDYRKQTNIEDYKRDFIIAHTEKKVI